MRVKPAFNERQIDEISGKIEFRKDIFHNGFIVPKPCEPLLEAITNRNMKKPYVTFDLIVALDSEIEN